MTTRTQSRLIVASGVIVDPLAQVAADMYWLVTPVSDPTWTQWQEEGSPVADYVPFQSEPTHKIVPDYMRDSWIGV